MISTQNQYEAAARVRKVMALTAAADRLVDDVGKDSLIDREIVLMALIGRLDGDDGEAERTQAWQALTCTARIKPPSEITKAATLTVLREQLILHRSPSDPFARLAGAS